jgi:adenylate cyclase
MPAGKIIRVAVVTLICAMLVLHSVGNRIHAVDALENYAYDLRLRLTAPGGLDQRVVIADIDERSLAAVGHWPWDRGVIADFMDALLNHYGARAVGFDILFAEPDTDPGVRALQEMADGALRNNRGFQRQWQTLAPQLDFDGRLADIIRDKPVVMGYVFDQGDADELNILPEPIGSLPESFQGRLNIPQPLGYSGNLPVLQEAAPYGGFFDNPAIDRDGVFRRVPLIQEYKGNLYGSLALGLLRAAENDPPVDLKLDTQSNYPYVDAMLVGDHYFPLGPLASVLVPYRGPAYSFPYVSIIDILEKKAPESVLKDRIVLIGTSAPGLKDQRTTPFESSYPGVEVHANLVAGLLDDNLMHEPGWLIAVEFFTLLLLSGVFGYFSGRLDPLRSLIFTASVIVILLGSNMWAWSSGLVLPIASPLVLVVVVFIFQMAWGFFVEARDKRAVTRLFGQYVPPELVEEMAQAPDTISVAGESRELTVLFSDVRGFTTISEGLEPQALTRLMNDMLTPMTRVIHQHRGTIDKYMGDAIMGFWGAPLEDPLHARHAVEAAIDMVERLPEINQRFRERGWPEINIGVGLNTGVMSVGNMGSEFRMAYTVMGDAVNLGSRLEGLTKQYGVNIIVSEFTVAAAPMFVYRELDRVRVKGKEEPVVIFEPVAAMDSIDHLDKDRIDRFHQALEKYRQQDWDAAEKILAALSAEEPQRMIYDVYLERIKTFRDAPPGSDWDGVFTHTSK